ncbi:hypothetical protein [Chitinophaga sp. Cy-1792]|uniref:hypothetical protein n=1 Tax=Chitinophaga sp. Cy-1792 TaxID=2608339 RepID=UPI001420484A|nr:hypothetical protein [Chitinophaga sp. Cy-1792]NIG52396.1 hypothetical protein [Chitinophaga sp. Cy-1792]
MIRNMYCLLVVMALSQPCLSQSNPKQLKTVAPAKREMSLIDSILAKSGTPVKQKKIASPISDLDRLYAKYKDKETVTIFSAGEEVTANIEIVYNDDDKPKAIILSGESYNKPLLMRIKDNLIAQKKQAGYQYVDNFSYFEGNLYQKGSMYAKYLVQDEFSSELLINKTYQFRFEVGDTKRAGSGKTETFTF